MSTIHLTVNGCPVTAHNEEQSLLAFLREDLGLVGAKDGCSKGQCGACTVIVNDRAQKSCLLKMGKLEGARVETIEGLEKDGRLHPIQLAFLKLSAYQCGFCTPGMIMQIKWFLEHNPNPTVEQIQKALEGHICRCTGYKKIVEAVQLAASAMRGETIIDLTANDGAMGNSCIRTDGYAKVTGRAVFTDDFHHETQHLLYGKFVWPAYAHARLLRVDTSEAKKMPGVAAIATAADVPGRNLFGQGYFPQQPIIAADVIRYVGDPIAVVYAESEAQAEAAAKMVKAEYEPLPVVSDMEEAAKPDSIKIYPEYEDGNYCSRDHTHKGNIERGFAISDVIVEGDFETQPIDHAYLEPDAALTEFDKDGKLVVHATVQGPANFRKDLAACLNLDINNIRVIVHPSGGAFGGREEPSCHIQAALGTLMTGRPVRIAFTREEVNFFTTKRHAMRMHYKLGATKDGKIQAIQFRTIGDTGAYASSGAYVLFRACVFGAGCYAIPNAWADTYSVYTNNTTAGSMRGFGSTQPAVPLESLVDELAIKLNIDPFEIRRINGLRIGEQTITGHVIDYSCGYIDCLNAVEAKLKADGLPCPSGPDKVVGWGVASSMKNVGLGSGCPDNAWAQMWLREDGKMVLSAGGVECGQGHDTIAVQIAAEALGVCASNIVIKIIDSDYTMDSGITTASRQTFVSGNACKGVGATFRLKMLEVASNITGISAGLLDLDKDGIFGIGEHTTFRMSFRELAEKAEEAKLEVYEKFFYEAPQTHPYHACSDNFDNKMVENRLHFAYCFCAQAVVVEIDKKTGDVKVLRVYAANDVGKAVNPALVEGQIEGGVAMGIGMALSENYIQKDGIPITTTLGSLHLPKSTDVPVDIQTIMVEEGHPYGPFGAKGMGELPLNATAPAILNAVRRATGVRIHKLPIDAKALAEAIRTHKTDI